MIENITEANASDNPNFAAGSTIDTFAGDPQATTRPQNTETATSSSAPAQPELDKLFNYAQASIQLRRIINEWSAEINQTRIRRLVRDVQVDTERLRQTGKLDEDETLIPQRVININIEREQPAYINYLKNSRRLALFNCLSEPAINTSQYREQLETEVTRGMTYQGWETSYYKCIDGAQTHGWDSVEVVYNPLFPLNCGIEHIGHDKLLFPQTITDIQQSPLLIRIYDVTRIQLESFVTEFGFDAEQVRLLFESRKDSSRENEVIQIYKEFFKYQGLVYVAWFSYKESCNNWLKKPEKAFVGTASDLTQYPVFFLPYRESEKPALFSRKGRVFLDEPKQEAQTAILSGFVNGLTRASNVYASTRNDNGTGTSLRELTKSLIPGRVLSSPIDFFSPPYPDPMVLRALQWMDTNNSNETNQLNFAALNRDDSRKTATELDMSQEQQTLMNSVQLTLFSTFVRSILSFSWLIIQNQAMTNKIVLLLTDVPEPVINPMTNTPIMDPATGQPMTKVVKKNNTEVIKQTYEVRAAGDVDVIQRQEKIRQMMQDWPVIANTPLAQEFLADMMKLKYQDKGEHYAGVLSQTPMVEQMKSLIARLVTVLQGAVNPEELRAMSQQEQSDLANLIAQAQSVVPQTAGASGPSQPKQLA